MAKVADICISMKAEDYLELPAIVYDTVPVILDSKAKNAYDELEKKMVLELVSANTTIDVTSAAALSNKLQQLANGAVYDASHEWYPVHDCKIEAFLELIEQLNGKPVLVFYNFRHDLERLEKALQGTKLKYKRLEGAKEMEEWNAGKIDVLLAHPASCAYGLNLQQGGNHVIWFGLNWSLELYQQANKRLHRQGQQEKVIVHHLVCVGTRDDDMIEALSKKDKAQEYVLESLKARIDKYVGGKKK
jgi:SNF2 family DNA or RNA helicase